MLRILIVFLILLVTQIALGDTPPARAINITSEVPTSDAYATGTLTSTSSVVSIAANGLASGAININGTFVGNIQVNCVPYGGTNINALNTLQSNFWTTAPITAAGYYKFRSGAGCQTIQAVFSSYTSGSATVYLVGNVAVSQPSVNQTNQLNLLSTVFQPTGTNLHTVVDSGLLGVTQSGTWSEGRTWNLGSSTDLVGAVQSGTWNIGNITGTISLPTGAATQATLAAISAQLPTTIGTKTAANSLSIALASDQISGMATSALQTSGNNYLSQIAANTASALTDITNTGTITSSCTTPASCAATSYVNVSAQGQYTVAISVTGTFVATYLAEGQNADSSWTQLPMYSGASGTVSSAYAATLSAPAQAIIIAGAYSNIRIRASAYTSGTISIALDASIAQQAVFSAQLGTWNVSTSPQDGAKATYSAAVYSLAPAATTPTDIFTINGSATKTVRVTRVTFTGTETTAAQRDLLLIKRSTADSGGTSSVLAAVPHDSTSAAATAVVRSYTANPTTGATVGAIRTRKVYIGTTSGNSDEFITEFGTRPSQAVVLRGTGESLVISLNSVASVGASLDISVEWTEE